MKDENFDIFKEDDEEEEEEEEVVVGELAELLGIEPHDDEEEEEEEHDELKEEEEPGEEEGEEEEEEEEEISEIPFIEEEEEEEEIEEEEEEEPEELPGEPTNFYLANKAYYEGDYENAIQMYDAAIKEDNDESVVAKSLYWKGESYVKLNRVDEAIKVFSNLIKQLGDHYLGASAERRIACLREIYDK